MARRSKRSSPPFLLLGTLLLGGMAVILAVLLLGQSSEPFRTTDPLDASLYLENANSLRGNVYRLNAEVMNALAMSRKDGRLISVKSSTDDLLPLIIPPDFNQENIQRGQHFVFVVEVDERGLLRVKDLIKQ